MNKQVKVRKVHNCDQCGREIQIGEQANFYSWKGPTFDEGDNQVGIEYGRGYICIEGECLPFEDD